MVKLVKLWFEIKVSMLAKFKEFRFIFLTYSPDILLSRTSANFLVPIFGTISFIVLDRPINFA